MMKSNLASAILFLLRLEDELPPPKRARALDVHKNDFEIFQKYILPMGGICALGDMWEDAPRKEF